MYGYQLSVTLMLAAFLLLVLRNLRDYAPPSAVTPPRTEERLFVLIPARNEAANIADCLRGLLAQNFPHFRLLVLDDASEDGTDRIVLEMAVQDSRLSLLRGKRIEAGWAGKVWACGQLGDAALDDGADWLLFLDADTRAQPDFIGALLAHAQQTDAGMVSTFPYQVTGTFWERVTLPMLQFLITTFLPVRLVWKLPFANLVAACGQVELFSAQAYRAIGGHGSIPQSFHDGLQLARRTKKAGFTVRLCDASALISCRMYEGGGAVWNGFTRNAYEGLGGFAPLLAMTALQTLYFLLPFVFLLWGILTFLLERVLPAWFGLVCLQISLIFTIRVLQARRFGHLDSLFLHPLSIATMVAIQWASLLKTLRRTPISWKGRTY
jgi:chlorobactene glucosyltransferase